MKNLRYKGISIPVGAMVHHSHSWARKHQRDQVSVGVDDLLVSTLGQADTVTLPNVGSDVRAGEVLFTLGRGQRRVDVRAPLSGRVVETNAQVLLHPELIASEPYADGWVARLEVRDLRKQRKRLATGQAARTWFCAEVDRLLSAAMPQAIPNGSMMDGGAMVADFHSLLDNDAWLRINRAFFSGVDPTAVSLPRKVKNHGGQWVGRGDYWCLSSGDNVHVNSRTLLPGEASTIYYRVPSLVLLMAAPIAGLSYVLFLPFIGLAMVAAVGIKALVARVTGGRAKATPRN